MSINSTEKQELIKEAYRFGYFVGYKGHTEWISWIAKKKGEIYKKAKLLGVYNEVKSAYERGLEDGKARKTREIEFGLSKLEIKESEDEEKIEGEYEVFSRTSKITEPPEILKLIKSIETPKMLSLPKLLGKQE